MDSPRNSQALGSAYLSPPSPSLVSITACYALIKAGADVPGLLEHGLTVTTTSESSGRSRRHAAHKAASPTDFPDRRAHARRRGVDG